MTDVKQTGPFERTVTLLIEDDALESAKGVAARRLSRDLKIKGFRPGKAPRVLVERTVGADRLREEAIEDALPALVATAIADEQLRPAVTPSVTDIHDVEGGVEVVVRITEWPTVEEPPEYRSRRVIVERPEVTDEDLDEQIDRMRNQFAELEDVSREAFDGDYALVDVRTSRAGEEVAGGSATDLLYEVGSESFLDGIDEALRGKAAGHIAEFETTLPPALAGEGDPAASARVLVKQVKAKRLPELTDEWVDDVTEFETVAELRTTLRSDLERYRLAGLRAEVESRVMEDLRGELDLMLPEALVQAEMEGVLHRFAHRLESQGIGVEQYLSITGQDRQAFVDDLRSQSEVNLLTRVLLEAIIESEGLTVDAAEIDTAIAALAREARTSVDEYRKALVEGGQEQALAGDILRRKAVDLVVDTAEVVDADGEMVDIPRRGESGATAEPDGADAAAEDADDDTDGSGTGPEPAEGDE